MKRLLWIFRIRRRIEKRLINVEKARAYFESIRVSLIQAGKPDDDNYIQSRLEIEKELGEMLRSLLQ